MEAAYNNNTVSIIIPVYNSANYIKDTILSCIEQTYKNIEIIVVNDGSTDDSEDIILSLADDRIKYFNILNGGACRARNFGISKAVGNLFQFLDADDILDKNKIAEQIESYNNYGDDFIYSGVMGTVNNTTFTLDEGYDLYMRDFTVEQYFETLLNQFGKYLTTGIWLIPSKIVRSMGDWDERIKLNQDGEYIMRAVLRSGGIKFCKKSYFYYRRDVINSISKKRDNRAIFESWLYSYESYVANFAKYLDKRIANELGWKALSVYYCSAYPNYPDLLNRSLDGMKTLGYNKPNAHGSNTLKKIAGIIGTQQALKLLHLKNKLK